DGARGAVHLTAYGTPGDLAEGFTEPDAAGHHDRVAAQRPARRIDHRSISARIEAECFTEDQLFRRGRGRQLGYVDIAGAREARHSEGLLRRQMRAGAV